MLLCPRSRLTLCDSGIVRFRLLLWLWLGFTFVFNLMAALPAAAAGQDGWRSLITEAPALRDKVKASKAKDKRGYELQQGHFALIQTPNAAIRVRTQDRYYLTLMAKWGDTPVDEVYGNEAHVARHAQTGEDMLFSTWAFEPQEENGMKMVHSSRQRPPSGITASSTERYTAPPKDGDYELELRAFGDHITVLLNGIVTHEYSNVILPGQGFAIQASRPVTVTSIDWRPLTPTGEPIKDSARILFPAPGSLPPNGATATASSSKSQTWTDSKGRSISAEFVRLTEDKLIVRMNNAESTIPLDQLSDQSYNQAVLLSGQAPKTTR